jgi:hypothetical protein
LHDGLTSKQIASVRNTLRKYIEVLGITEGTPITTISRGYTVLTQTGRLLLQVWLTSWNEMVFNQVLEPSAFNVGVDVRSESTARGQREEQWAKMLMKSFLERKWFTNQRDVSVGALVGLLYPAIDAGRAGFQFKAFSWGAGFKILAHKDVGPLTYARINWNWPHEVGSREFIVRYPTHGDLLKDGFQAFVTYNTTNHHFYSSVSIASINTFFNSVDDSLASIAAMNALNPWTFSWSGSVRSWFLDLLDPPSPVPAGYPGSGPISSNP